MQLRIIQTLPKSLRPRSAGTPAPSAEVVDALTDALIDMVPNFHETVPLGVQRQDPFAAQAAMTALGHGLRTIASQKQVTTLAPDAASPLGFAWHDANIVTEINGFVAINGLYTPMLQ